MREGRNGRTEGRMDGGTDGWRPRLEGEGTVQQASSHLGDTPQAEGVHSPRSWGSVSQEKVQDARVSPREEQGQQVALLRAGRARGSPDVDSHVPVTRACLWGAPRTLAEGPPRQHLQGARWKESAASEHCPPRGHS